MADKPLTPSWYTPPAILAFLAAHKVSSHTIAAALLGFFALYTSDQQFATWLNGLVAHWPKVAGALVVAAGIYLKYSPSLKALTSSSQKVTQ